MKRPWEISRRTFLMGGGALVALPLLEQMLPSLVRAAEPAPRRFVVFNSPAGVAPGKFTPRGGGADFTLSPILSPLEDLKDSLLVVSGLTNPAAKWSVAGAGHARGAGSWLTCTPVPRTLTPLKSGVSLDQVAAETLSVGVTRLKSLELGTSYGQNSGSCDFGFNCAYQNNVSWGRDSSPMPREVNPQLAFDRLFSPGTFQGGPEAAARRQARRRSILDLVRDDAQSVQKKLGKADSLKVGEYLNSLREYELRLQASSTPLACESGARPVGVPDDHPSHVRLMLDLAVLALQCDATRVITFQYEHSLTDRVLSFLKTEAGVPINDAYHGRISHHNNDVDKLEKYRIINTWVVSQLGYLLRKMKGITESGASLLDNSIVLFGSEMTDGNQHNFDNLPVAIAGTAGGQFVSGRHLKAPDGTPLSNLYVTLLQLLGIPTKSFGDSTGALSLSGG